MMKRNLLKPVVFVTLLALALSACTPAAPPAAEEAAPPAATTPAAVLAGPGMAPDRRLQPLG